MSSYMCKTNIWEEANAIFWHCENCSLSQEKENKNWTKLIRNRMNNKHLTSTEFFFFSLYAPWESATVWFRLNRFGLVQTKPVWKFSNLNQTGLDKPFSCNRFVNWFAPIRFGEPWALPNGAQTGLRSSSLNWAEPNQTANTKLFKNSLTASFRLEPSRCWLLMPLVNPQKRERENMT